MKISVISDIHTQWEDWSNNLEYQFGYDTLENWNNSDMVLFCGDASYRGTYPEIKQFLDWFSSLPQKYKIMIAGNHDFLFEDYPEEAENLLSYYPNIIYLNDSGVEIEGINIWGSPITPFFHSWAFNRHRGNDINKHWKLIPKETDILIVHGPPHMVLDELSPKFRRPGEDINVGCKDLAYNIQWITKPKYVCFGHIHEGYGKIEMDGTTYINASCLTDNYKPNNLPIFIDYE